jgi:hypothetical protein
MCEITSNFERGAKVVEAKEPGMSSVHERNLRNGKRVLENLRANMASDMPSEEVFVRLGRDLDTVELHAYVSYAHDEYSEDYSGVEEPQYSNVMVKMAILQGYMLDYLNGKVTSDGALASISKRLKKSLTQLSSSDPELRGNEGKPYSGAAQDAPTSTPMATPQEEVVKSMESFRGDITRVRDIVDRALSRHRDSHYTSVSQSAFYELISMKQDSRSLLHYLDLIAPFIPSLSVREAFEEDLRFRAKVRRVFKKAKELNPAVWREGPSSRP